MRNSEFFLVKLLFGIFAFAQFMGIYSGMYVRQILDLELLAGIGIMCIALFTIEGLTNVPDSSILRGVGSNFSLGLVLGEIFHLWFLPTVETDLVFFALLLAFSYVVLATWMLIHEVNLFCSLHPERHPPALQAWAGSFILPILVIRMLLPFELTARLQRIQASRALRIAAGVFHISA